MKTQRKTKTTLAVLLIAVLVASLCNMPIAFAESATFYSEDFSSTTDFGNFTVSDGHAVAGADIMSNADVTVDSSKVTENWVYSMDVTFPADVYNFVGVHMYGLVEGVTDSYEFTVQRTPEGEPDYMYVKTATGEVGHSNGAGGVKNPTLPVGTAFEFKIIKIGGEFSLLVDDELLVKANIDNTTPVTNFSLFTYNASGAVIDNIVFAEYVPTATVTAVTLTSDRTTLSTKQTANLTATVDQGAVVDSWEWYVNGSKVDGATGNAFVFSGYAAGAYTVKCKANGVESNEIALTVTEATEEEQNSVYFEDFSTTSSFGAFSIEDGKAVIASNDVVGADIMLDQSTIPANWEYTMKVRFPEGVYNFIGVNFFNLVEGDTNSYEFTVQNVEGEDAVDYTLVKSGGRDIAHSNGTGGKQNPVLPTTEFTFRVVKVGSAFNLYIDDVLTLEATIENTAAINKINIFGYMAQGAYIDDITLKEFVSSTQVTEVTVTSNKSTVSETQSATIGASANEGAIPVEYKWYVDDNLVEDAVQRTFTFAGYAIGDHTVYCVADGVKSNVITVKVTAASQEELDSIYFENFDNSPDGTAFGNFTVSGGKLVPAAASYSNYTMNPEYVMNWEYSMDVVFTEQKEAPTYVGLTVNNMSASIQSQIEFNLKKAGTNLLEGDVEDKDQIILKINGVEQFFNDSELGGKMESVNFAIGETYKLRVVRWDDQLEVYINGEIAIKYVFPEPALINQMFVYTYCDNGPAITVDNIVYKESEEITDRVEPPTIAVTGAYISSGAKDVKPGEGVVLSVNCYPYNATPKTFQWYVNGEAIEGATAATYTFTSDKAGEYVFKCVVDGTVESETKTITVTAPADGGDDGGGNNTVGIVIGCVAGGLVLIGAIVAIVIFIKKKKAKA